MLLKRPAAGHRLGGGGNGGCRFLGGRLAAIVPLGRVENFLLIVRHQLRFLFEQPGYVARDTPFVPPDAPDTSFRVYDAARSRAHQSRVGIGPYCFPLSNTNQSLASQVAAMLPCTRLARIEPELK
jgi:hypothetical protein